MRGDDRMDMILHEKGPQRSLIRNKPTETLVNGWNRKLFHGTQLVSSLQCGVETRGGK